REELERLAQAREAHSGSARPATTGTPSEVDAALPPVQPGPTRVEGPDYPLEEPVAGVEGPSLAACYAVLGLPPGSSIERVEHAYHRLRAENDPERLADDPLAQARAQQRVAQLDEAYLTLRAALVRERRL
ncbi:MAG: J domain-containing protein, partial [Armatimonadota bacterium]|nr:J domain-containing protein [Armatimonadota bacterium]